MEEKISTRAGESRSSHKKGSKQNTMRLLRILLLIASNLTLVKCDDHWHAVELDFEVINPESVAYSEDGHVAAVGIFGGDDESEGTITVYSSTHDSNLWTAIHGNVVEGEDISFSSSYSLALSMDGTALTVGNCIHAGPSRHGQIRVYKDMENSWQQVNEMINVTVPADEEGYMVSITNAGDEVIVGGTNDNGLFVNVYEDTGTEWTIKESLSGTETVKNYSLEEYVTYWKISKAFGTPSTFE